VEVFALDREKVGQALDPGLVEQHVLGGAEAREVEEERLVAPVHDVHERRADLVGEVLPPRPRLRHLEQEAGREDAVALEAREVDRQRSRELVDGRHGRHVTRLPVPSRSARDAQVEALGA